MKILITGANGQLGLALQKLFPDAIATDHQDLDISDAAAVAAYNWAGIEVIINAAAFTDVDGSETQEGRKTAWRVNASAVRNLAQAAIAHNLTLVHISSEYVFDGSAELHIEDEPFSPLGVYGQAKAAGDIAASLVPKHYIVRTSWVIGEGKNFVRTILGVGKKGISPTVVADQIGRPTFTSDLAAGIKHLLDAKAPAGTYNLSNEGPEVSWAEFTRNIFKAANLNLEVNDTTTAEYFAGKVGTAPRPLRSTLDLKKIESAGFTPRDWQEALAEYIKEQA